MIVAIWAQSALLHFLPASERINLGRTTLDPMVFAFALAVAVATAIGFGLIPALQISGGAFSAQQGDPRMVRSDMSPLRFRGALVLLQIALSLPLLIGAGLFLHSLRNLKAIAPGFDESQVVVASLNPSLNGYHPNGRKRFTRVSEPSTGSYQVFVRSPSPLEWFFPAAGMRSMSTWKAINHTKAKTWLRIPTSFRLITSRPCGCRS